MLNAEFGMLNAECGAEFQPVSGVQSPNLLSAICQIIPPLGGRGIALRTRQITQAAVGPRVPGKRARLFLPGVAAAVGCPAASKASPSHRPVHGSVGSSRQAVCRAFTAAAGSLCARDTPAPVVEIERRRRLGCQGQTDLPLIGGGWLIPLRPQRLAPEVEGFGAGWLHHGRLPSPFHGVAGGARHRTRLGPDGADSHTRPTGQAIVGQHLDLIAQPIEGARQFQVREHIAGLQGQRLLKGWPRSPSARACANCMRPSARQAASNVGTRCVARCK